jgi:hypothetical protein
VAWTRLERVAVLVISVAVAAVVIVVLSGAVGDRDSAGVNGSVNQVGDSFADQGDARLVPDQPHPRYDSQPPTSGPHVPVAVTRDARRLSVDQLLSLLAAGDIVIDYGSRHPSARLRALADTLAGRFSPALAADGQAIVLARHPHTVGLLALAWTRIVQVSGARQPLLRQFIEAWLGRGTGSR